MNSVWLNYIRLLFDVTRGFALLEEESVKLSIRIDVDI